MSRTVALAVDVAMRRAEREQQEPERPAARHQAAVSPTTSPNAASRVTKVSPRRMA